jgi:hypothetical protein
MPMTRGRILGYDKERMAFGFSMLNGSEEVVCQISAAAIDELAGGPRGKYVDRETQFSLMRETIERLAIRQVRHRYYRSWERSPHFCERH